MVHFFFQVCIIHCQIHEITAWRYDITLSIIQSKYDIGEWPLNVGAFRFLDPAITLLFAFVTLDLSLSWTWLLIELIFHDRYEFREHCLRNLNGTEESVNSGISKVISCSIDIRESPWIIPVTNQCITDSKLPFSLTCWLIPIDRHWPINLIHHHIWFTSKGNIRT